jgi:CMP-N,N'-diacetyllegionaminic acid synthase
MQNSDIKIETMKEVLAIIPARGGSKGIPRKNVFPLLGKPLIAYTIEQALAAKRVSRVVVSTDDDEIAQVSKKFGAEVIMRPGELAVDSAPTWPVIVHAVKHLQDRGYNPDYVTLMQCTSPIREPHDIDNAIDTLEKEGADSVLSVVDNHGFLWKAGEDSAVSINYDYNNRQRRQDKDPEYRENGSIYVIKTPLILESNNYLAGKVAMYVMDSWKSLEIDDELDLFLVEKIMEHKGIK